MADTMGNKEAPRNEALELDEVENNGNLFEKGMKLGYEKMDLEKELQGLIEESNFDENNPECQALNVEISLVDTQIDSLATQWADKKVPDLIKDPERRSKRVEIRKKHFLARLHRKLVRNGRKINRYEKQDEHTERGLNRRLGRLERKQQRQDAKQEARSERRAGRKSTPAQQARWEAQDIRQDARQKRRADRIKDRLERGMDKTGDIRDARTVVYDKGGVGDPGAPWNADNSSYAYRGDQGSEDAFDQGGIEGGYRQDQLGDNPVALRLLRSDPSLDPSALTSSDARVQMQAIRVVYADEPEEIAYFEDALSQPQGSADREEAIANLQERQGELAKPYEIFRDGEIARRQVDKGALTNNLWDKFSTLAGDFSRNPVAIAGVVGCLVGVYLLRDKIFTKDNAKILGVIAGAIGLGVVGDAALKSLSASHEGILDRIGFHPGDALAPEVLERYRAEHFPSLPKSDQQAVDDMIRLLKTPMTAMNDSFESALDDQKLEINTESFLGKGVDSKAEGDMDGKSLYKGMEWFYGECAQRSSQLSGRPLPANRDQKMRLGLAYAKSHFQGMSFEEANYKLNLEPRLQAAKLTKGDAAPTQARKIEPFARELFSPREPKLKALADKDRDFGQLLWELPSGELLIKGYPYKYHYSDQGKYVFVDAFDPSRVISIPDNLQPGDLHQRLAAMGPESATAVAKKFSEVKGSLTNTLKYRPSGEWTLDPPLERMSHEGLDPTMSSDKIPFLYYADQTGFHMTFDGAKNKANFDSIDALRKAYDLQRVVPTLVTKDANHLLLGLDFTVEDVKDSASDKTTSVVIRYDSGHTGTLLYKEGHLESLKLEETAALNTLWEKESRKDTVALFSRSTIQEPIIEALGINPDVYVRWNNMVTTGVVSSEPNIEFAGGLFGTAGKTFMEMFDAVVNSNDITGSTVAAREKSETEKSVDTRLGALIVTMHTQLTELYKQGYSKTKYEEQKKILMQDYETQINKIVSAAPVDVSLPPEDVVKMKTEADSRIADALSPMKHYSLDANQKALYTKRLIEWQQKTAMEIDALGPDPKKPAVEKIIRDNCALATAEANEHRGLDTNQSGDLLREEELTGTHKLEWKGPSEKVYSFIKERFNWKGAQINELMKIYYSKIDHGNAPATASSADTYATFFMSSVYMIMGTKETNLDRAKQLFIDEFETKKPVLLSIKSSRDFNLHPETLPTPPELKDGKEMHKEHVKEEFTKWFDQNMDLSTWTGIEGDYPNTFRDSVNKRFDRIVMDDSLTSARLSQEVQRFTQFVTVEYALYKICVDGTYYQWYDIVKFQKDFTDPIQMRDQIVEKNFDALWSTGADSNAYATKLDADFGVNVAGYEKGLLFKRLLQIGVLALPFI